MNSVKIIECPRDAWQGLPRIIPTAGKIEYLRNLLAAGFRHIDAVSFVSPKLVPQMADSEAVMAGLQDARLADGSSPEIIAIVVNEKGIDRALAAPGVSTLGYPYSISAYFRRANANMSRAESRSLVEHLRAATASAGRSLVVYVSMAFGNPYEEPWGPEIVLETLLWLKSVGVATVSLADTVGLAAPHDVASLFRMAADSVPEIELGLHLHSRPERAAEKILAAYEAGCRRFDGALTGLGGCPFAADELVGNIPTEAIVTSLAARGVSTGLSAGRLAVACALTETLGRQYSHALGDLHVN